MSVIWSGVTEEGAVVPVQVTDEGKVVAVGDGPQGDYLPITGGTLTGDLNVADGISLRTDGSADFSGAVLNDSYFQSNRSNEFDTAYIGKLNDVEKVNIRADGSASFQGAVGIGGTNNPDASLASIALHADGSAEFDDNVLIDRYLTVTNSEFSADAKVQIQGDTEVAISVYPAISAGARTIELRHDGSASFSGLVTTAQLTNAGSLKSSRGIFRNNANGSVIVGVDNINDTNYSAIQLRPDGSGVFSGDVVIGSRGEKWLIRESNGVAMLVQQSRDSAPMPGVSPMIPEQVRDLPAELDLIETALNEVMEKLRMTPPAGWPVWDGSDNP